MLKGIKGIHHLAISVPDLRKARAFYCGVLGFEVAEEFDFGPDEESDHVTQVKGAAADAQIEVQEQITGLEKKIGAARGKLTELADAGEDVWEDVKKGAENAWDDLMRWP